MCYSIGGESVDFAHDWEVFFHKCVWIVDIEPGTEFADPVECFLLVCDCSLARDGISDDYVAISLQIGKPGAVLGFESNIDSQIVAQSLGWI